MPIRTVEHLIEETGIGYDQIAAKSGLPVARVAAIAEGRWTPSPYERECIAQALGVAIADVSWGHTMNPRNIRYGRHGFKENF